MRLYEKLAAECVLPDACEVRRIMHNLKQYRKYTGICLHIFDACSSEYVAYVLCRHVNANEFSLGFTDINDEYWESLTNSKQQSIRNERLSKLLIDLEGYLLEITDAP